MSWESFWDWVTSTIAVYIILVMIAGAFYFPWHESAFVIGLLLLSVVLSRVFIWLDDVDEDGP